MAVHMRSDGRREQRRGEGENEAKSRRGAAALMSYIFLFRIFATEGCSGASQQRELNKYATAARDVSLFDPNDDADLASAKLSRSCVKSSAGNECFERAAIPRSIDVLDIFPASVSRLLLSSTAVRNAPQRI